jgi:hypothetical protein
MTTMCSITKAVAAVALAAGVSIAGIAGAGAASADEAEYDEALQSSGSPLAGEPELSNMAAMNSWGHRICADWAAGENRDTIVERTYSGTDENIDREEAQFMVDAAISYLCPWPNPDVNRGY